MLNVKRYDNRTKFVVTVSSVFILTKGSKYFTSYAVLDQKKYVCFMAWRYRAQVIDPMRRVRFTAEADCMRHIYRMAYDSKSASFLRSPPQLLLNLLSVVPLILKCSTLCP